MNELRRRDKCVDESEAEVNFFGRSEEEIIVKDGVHTDERLHSDGVDANVRGIYDVRYSSLFFHRASGMNFGILIDN